MPFKSPLRGLSGAIGSPLAAVSGHRINGRDVKVIGALVVAGLVGITSTRDMAGYWPTVIAGATFLSILAYRWKANRRLFSAVLFSWPVVAVVSFALAGSPGADDKTGSVAELANSQTMLRSEQFVDLLGRVGGSLPGIGIGILQWAAASIQGLVRGFGS